MTRSNPLILNPFRRGGRESLRSTIPGTALGHSVHVTLSKCQRSYSVFLPASHDFFPLFKVILVLSDPAERSSSPLDTGVNLKTTFEFLRSNQLASNDEDQGVIAAFVNEFSKEHRKETGQDDPQVLRVSEYSLLTAGVKLSSHAGALMNISASRESATTRKIRLKHHFSEAYQGGPQLQTLIGRHAQPVFRLILEQLHDDENFPARAHDRGLLAIVTKRIVSTLGVSKSAETATAVGVGVGDQAGTLNGKAGAEHKDRFQEEYDDLHRVSGLLFILFPVECTKENVWRFYRGNNVCNADMSDNDESLTQKTRDRNRFYNAQKWVLGEAELLHSSESTSVQRPHSAQMRVVNPSPEISGMFSRPVNKHDDSERQGYLQCVKVSRTQVAVPWVEVDIRPLLNKFCAEAVSPGGILSQE